MKMPLLLLLLAGLLSAGPAAAQDTTAPARASVSTDTTTSAQPPQRRVMMQPRTVAPAPRSVMQVRQRVGRIGPGGRTMQRVIYPMIVVPQVQVTVMTDEDGRVITQPRSAPPQTPLYPYPTPRRDDYDPYRRYDFDDDPHRDPSVIDLRDGARADSAAIADSLLAPPPDAGQAPPPRAETPPPPPPREDAPPTVRRVERAVLETGLFRAVGVNFEFNQSTLLPEAEATLDVVGETMQKYPDLRFRIDGHTDAVGSEAYNQELSARRATAVRDYLVGSFGIDAGRLDTRGFGESEPIATNATATGRTLNRRVEFSVTNPGALEQYREAIIEGERPADQQLRESLRRIIRQEIERMQRGDGGGGSN